jgi:hypothetical protein
MIYDTIVVGSGNGACGFLSYYLEASAERSNAERILVVEEGQDFFNTSDITHQKNWTKSYTEEKIYKLHQAFTPEGTPIIAGRACTMGGGGSLNYSMIHESSVWLAKHIGKTESYWDCLKQELNKKFNRPDPLKNLSPVTKYVLTKAQAAEFQLSSIRSIFNIPNHQESDDDLLHIFTTQFNRFGQRTNSGVSLLDWTDPRIELKTCSRVTELEFSSDREGEARCVGVNVKNLGTGETQFFSLKPNGRLILCAGAATPRLLMPYRERLRNNEIGQHVNDHIAIPLGIYTLDRENIDATQRDNYVPVFATTVWKPEQQGTETVCTFDFFSGDLPQLLFFFPQLYFPFLVPNWLKTIVIKMPWLFHLVKNAIREFIRLVNLMINIWWSLSDLFKGKSWRHEELPLITAVLKFNPGLEGYYSNNAAQIILRLFSDDEYSHFNQDKEVAKYALKKHLATIDTLGKQPSWIFRCFFQLISKIPYTENQVDRYNDIASKRFLATEQHMSGGCLFGKAIDRGLENAIDTGKIYGSANVYVADLSSVPLPRVSTQMTAYLIGSHVAKMWCSDNN